MVSYCGDEDASEICFAYSIIGCFYFWCAPLAHCLMCCCPPCAVWLENIETLNGYDNEDRYGIFACFGKNPKERADPAEVGKLKKKKKKNRKI